jgi:LPPG:FO 2-phospho-L-lactate transferase
MAGPVSRPSVVLLTGGLGGARLAPQLRDVLGEGRLSIVANVGDNLTWHGLLVCPDLDSVAYALAGLWDSERGWGLRDETFRVRDTLADLHQRPWFNVGDRDLAQHLLRTDHLSSGHSLTHATQELLRRLGITSVEMLPASDESSETYVLLEDSRLLHFQEWYVRERADPKLTEVRLAGGVASKAALHALESADAVILGPSNPITSIGAILALDGIEEAIRSAPRRIAVSPVVVGVEPNDAGVRHHALARRRALATVGLVDTPGAIAGLYAGLAELFLIDNVDAGETEEVRRARLEPVQADLLDSAALAQTLADLCT